MTTQENIALCAGIHRAIISRDKVVNAEQIDELCALLIKLGIASRDILFYLNTIEGCVRGAIRSRENSSTP